MTRQGVKGAGRWDGLLAGLLSGAAMPLALAPLSWAWLAPPALALLFYAAYRARSARAAAAIGFAHGLTQYGLGAAWVYGAVAGYGTGAAAAAVTYLVLVLLYALYPMLAMGLARTLRSSRPGVSLLLLYPACFVLLAEWLRSWLLTGNTWLAPGYAWSGGWLSGIAPVLGLNGITAALAMLGGALGWVFLQPRRRALTALLLVVLASTALSALGMRGWSQPAGEPLEVALVQGNFPPDLKWSRAQRSALFEHYRQATLAHADADVVIWPETALPVWYDEIEHNYLQSLRDGLGPEGPALLLGLPRREGRGGAEYNAVISLEGAVSGFYDKRHLVPIGEYLPFEAWLGDSLNVLGSRMTRFKPGGGDPVLRVRGVPLAPAICFEIIFGGELRRALPQAQLILTVSDDAWFGDSWAPHQHLQMARMRALETGREVVRATNTGLTAVIASNGRLRATLPPFTQDVLRARVQPLRGVTPYVYLGDSPLLSVSGGVLLIAAARKGWRPLRARQSGRRAPGGQA